MPTFRTVNALAYQLETEKLPIWLLTQRMEQPNVTPYDTSAMVTPAHGKPMPPFAAKRTPISGLMFPERMIWIEFPAVGDA